MGYITALRKNDDVLIWERTDEGRSLRVEPAPFYFYVKDDAEGKFTSIYGDKLTRFDFNTSKEFNMARAECTSNGVEMFESDIPPELKVLSEQYHNVPAPKLHVTFLDIEVDYDPELGFSSVENPYAPINSVAIYHNWSNRMVVYAIPPYDTYEGDPSDLTEEGFMDKLHAISELPTDVEIEVVFCKNEKEILAYIIAEIEDSDIISGWNSDFFDVPYIGKRVKKVLGARYFNMLSFDGANPPKWRTVEVMRREMETLDLSGRASVDYMVLFRKYEMAERPSYKLEAIADEMLPELPKLEYEGSLAGLYRKDFPYFVRYNLRDTEILKGFEERLGYVDLANQMYHMSTGLVQHVTGTLKLAELATINYCHHDLDGLVVNDTHVPDEDAQIQGAFVLMPQVGMHDFIGSVDINSLYPSAIRSINISPETIRGQFVEDSEACKEIAKNSDKQITFRLEEDGKVATAKASDWRKAFKEMNWAVSGYGTVFDQTNPGIIPSILDDWYKKRKEYQKKKLDAKNEANRIAKEYDENARISINEVKTAAGEGGFDCAKTGEGSPEYTPDVIPNSVAISAKERIRQLKIEATYYDKLQYVYKIKLNSFYGALTNKYFRFYDLRMGESTTGTGRMILTHQCAKVGEVLDGEYIDPDRREVDENGKVQVGYSDKTSVVYGDTDSSYFVTHAPNINAAVKIADKVGELVNDSFPEFMRETFLCGVGYDDIIKTGREIVADRGIFVDKKRYILHIVDDEGFKVDKMKVMGLDTKKTTMPKEISNDLNNFVGRLLKGERWEDLSLDIVEYKEKLENATDIMSIGLPKGVKGVEDYTKQYEMYGDGVRLPGHVAASILYNICLKEYDDKESMPIFSGMKIKVFYLKRKIGRFKSIAIPVDIEQMPKWFMEDFVERIDRDAHIERLVDNPLGNIIKAVGLSVPTRQQLLVDDVLEF